jgi:hypothetical protein
VPASTPSETPTEARARLRRQSFVLVGVGLTFGGLLLAAAALPNTGTGLEAELPYFGGALITLWLGGLLLGRGAGRRRS